MPTLTPRREAPPIPRPQADRLRRPRWTHPRALAGAALVVVSMALGGLLVASVAQTTEVWAVTGDVRAGEPVRADDLERVEVRLGADVRGRYLRDVDSAALVERLSDATWARPLSAGELVPESAVTTEVVAGGVEVPLAVGASAMPADLGPGHRVDVWVARAGGGGSAGGGAGAPARQVLSDVEVVAVHGDGSAFGDGTADSVVVRVSEGDIALLPDALAALADGAATLVRRAGAVS